MDLKDFFDSEYIEIKSTDENAIKIFLEEDYESIRKYKEPLKATFMHKTFNEMYLILDCINFNLPEVKELLEEWENSVLSYINFGEEYLENKKFLKYNIVIMILCKDLPKNDDDIFRYEIEKSKKICRKIFILVDKNGEIIDSNKTMLPFYFKPIEDLKNSIEEEYENKLKSILPQEESVKKVLERKTTVNFEDEEVILRWLDNNDK